jgi:hypothetical protein
VEPTGRGDAIDPWPLEIDLELTRIELIVRDWLSVIRAEGVEPVADVAAIIDGARMLAYQCASIELDQAARGERRRPA